MERKIKQTFIAVIKNSTKTRMFRNFFVKENEKVFDAMRNGELSCAFYVSTILKMFDMISGIHGTVEKTILDLEKNGWKKNSKPKIGSVLVWEKQNFGDENHSHIGSYLGRSRAISNDSTLGYPIRHNWKFDGKRKIETIYWKELK
ncbi:MAG: hypothetical protein NTW79_03725 [Candidatus Berkelbacteria bacterium]|nr:hypothetical protein [Candidatus Berkelbacteria bacterium]